tara:strand:- start:775 stop:1035 length:261 start_codon:yes stop_codon:yes gene_type:complete
MNDKELIIEFAEKIVQRGLSVPAIFLLESTKYISFIAGQTLIFFEPILTIFIKDKKYYDFIDLIEKKENIEMLIDQIEKNNASLNK